MADVIYRYDGTFDGFLCCVFESYTERETPAAILSVEEGQATLYPEKWVGTVEEHAARVFRSLSEKISPEAREFMQKAFLTNLEEKELYMYRFIRQGYREGPRIMRQLTDETVHVLQKAVRFLGNEAHLLTEFIRFSQYGNVLASVIHPKNKVLPLIAGHFCDRFPQETFLIYDATHRMALSYTPYEARFLELASYEPPEAGEEERQYRALWKRFFKTIAVEGRINPKCQRTHLPIRYRADMTEFQTGLPGQSGQESLTEEKRRLTDKTAQI